MILQKIDTGIKELNKMLGGGLSQNRVVLLSGASGTGKTTLGVQFIYNGIKNYLDSN